MYILYLLEANWSYRFAKFAFWLFASSCFAFRLFMIFLFFYFLFFFFAFLFIDFFVLFWWHPTMSGSHWKQCKNWPHSQCYLHSKTFTDLGWLWLVIFASVLFKKWQFNLAWSIKFFTKYGWSQALSSVTINFSWPQCTTVFTCL